MIVIRAEQLGRTYVTPRGEVRALVDVNLEIAERDFAVLRGPSGCGKTTLLLTLGGMLRPGTGRVLWRGEDLYAWSAARRAALRARDIGFVFQMFHLIPYLTVLENVRLATQGESDGGVGRAGELLDRMGLAARREHRPGELSAGERQRAALARALAARPSLLLADEPTGNLDPANARLVFAQIARFHEEGGTVFVVTHGGEAEAHATRRFEMREGRLVG